MSKNDCNIDSVCCKCLEYILHFTANDFPTICHILKISLLQFDTFGTNFEAGLSSKKVKVLMVSQGFVH